MQPAAPPPKALTFLVGALVAFSIAVPTAQAQGPSKVFIEDPAGLEILLATAVTQGIQLHNAGPMCDKEPNLYGVFLKRGKSRALVACFDNIRRAGLSLDLVVRHELIHAVQDCIGLVRPGFNYATTFQLPGYPEDQLQVEAEARVISVEATNEQVASLLSKACSNPTTK